MKFLQKRNYEADRKMAKGHRTKWLIHNRLMIVICDNKLALKIMEKRNDFVTNPIVMHLNINSHW